MAVISVVKNNSSFLLLIFILSLSLQTVINNPINEITTAKYQLYDYNETTEQALGDIPDNGGRISKKKKDDLSQSNQTKGRTMWSVLYKKVKDGGMTDTLRCSVSTMENLHNFIDVAEEEEKITLFEFVIRLANYSTDPFQTNTSSLFFKPWLWYTTRSRHGRTLLMLSFHYDVLSMNILTIGVKTTYVDIVDEPFGCFGQLPMDQRIRLIRKMLLSRSPVGKSSLFGKSTREEFACNQEILEIDGYAEFVYNCCFKNQDGEVVCSTKGDDFWINVLYFLITSVKVLVFVFCPKFLPSNIYSAAYVASEYVVSLKEELKMKIFISEQADANVRFKKRLTLEDVSEWWRFREKLDELPCDEIVPVKVSELRIKVKGKRIIPESDPPTGLMRTFYDNLIRCKIKNLDPFTECCETSIFADMEPAFRHKITWHKFVQVTVRGLMLLLIPIPYYVRLYVYFMFEEGEISKRREAMEKNNLKEGFNFYRTNVIQYYTPTHGVFIATYIFYFLMGLVIGFSDAAFRERLKSVARSALGDMSVVSQTGVLGIIIRLLVYPFKKYGLLAFLIAPFYLCFMAPLCAIVFVLYCLPTVYLSFRLPYHAKKLAGASEIEAEKKRKLKRMHKLGRRIAKMDRSAHHGDSVDPGESCCPEELGWGGFHMVKNIIIQVLCSIFCLCILYSISLVFAESTGLFVEVMAFTMMGIIVNAGSVLKYVSMVLLVFVYMNDCYSNVYENYLMFNKTIIDEIIDRTTADLRKIASMSSSQQENTAFQVKCVDEEKEIAPSLNFDKKEARWKVGQLLLFLDCFDTPRIPLRLFQRLCKVRVYGAPGPVYINLLAATGKFMIIVVFLMFVMIVVMAFGNVYQMSSTNTTLATLAGGFVPMLLKNVLKSRGSRLSLKTVSFKGQIDEIIGEYKQYWPILDLPIERDIPEEKKEDEEGNGEEQSSEEGQKNVDGEKAGKDSEKDDHEKKHESGTGADKGSKDGGSPNKGNAVSSDKSPSIDGGIRKDSLQDLKKNGGIAQGNTHLPKVEEDEGLVDIFLDLSVADTAGWSIYGSNESLPSDSIMPKYFDPNKITIHQPELVDGVPYESSVHYVARDCSAYNL